MVNVAVCSADLVVSQLLALNLNRRGFVVRQTHWAPCCGGPEATPDLGGAALIIADLDCSAPTCWTGATRLRRAAGDLPILFLGHEWPDPARLQSLQPCGYLRNPFALQALIQLLHQLTTCAREEQSTEGYEARSHSGGAGYR